MHRFLYIYFLIKYTLYSGAIAKNVSLDLNAIPSDAEGGTYSVTISCDDYADIYVAIPVTEHQKTQLQELIKQAETALKGAGADDSVLLAHKNEAAELLANESSTSADAADLINELTELLKPYQSTEHHPYRTIQQLLNQIQQLLPNQLQSLLLQQRNKTQQPQK